MSHAGFSSCPEDARPEPNLPEHEGQSRPACGRYDAACGIYHQDDDLVADSPGATLPIQAARADAEQSRQSRESQPFVLQAGRIMFLVAQERNVWVLAELRFDAATCTFAEERRTLFQWPREVFGRLLSRTIVGDDIDLAEANRVADAFSRWLSSQFVVASR